jgi:hypothetical protein
MLALELSTGGEPQFTTKKLRDELECTRGVNPSSPKEEHEEEKQQHEEKKAAAGLPANEDTIKCSIHNVAMKRRGKGGKVWYSHRLADGTWCKDDGRDVGQDKHITDRHKYAEWENE